MIKRKGDLFTTKAKALGHGVNTRGVMGAGIAVAFKEKYPNNYKHYNVQCNIGWLKPGMVFSHKENDKYIFNIASQNNPGADASYLWLLQGALDAAVQAQEIGLDLIAIPQIGCGIGGLAWCEVEDVLLAVEIAVPKVQFEVWKFVPPTS